MAAPFWIKLAASELVRYKLVAGARIHARYLAVRYKSGLIDKYYFSGQPPRGIRCFSVRESDLKVGETIPISKTYEINPLDVNEQNECAHHLYMDRKQFRSGSFIDGRFAIHRFVIMLSSLQPALDRYPDRSIRSWVADLRKFNYVKMISSDAFNFYRQISVRVPWRQVLLQFFPVPLSYNQHRVERILTRHELHLDTAMVNRGLLRRSQNILNPLAYCALLNNLGTCQAVIDLHPEHGYKAIACGLLGVRYIYRECEEMERALERRIVDLLDLDCAPLDCQRADVLLSDGNFERFDIDEATHHLGRVNTMVAYAPRADRLTLTAKYKPSIVVKVLCRYRQGRRFKQTSEDPDFLLVW